MSTLMELIISVRCEALREVPDSRSFTLNTLRLQSAVSALPPWAHHLPHHHERNGSKLEAAQSLERGGYRRERAVTTAHSCGEG